VLGWIRELDAAELIDTRTWRGLQGLIDADLARFGELETRGEAYRGWRAEEARRRRARSSTLRQITYTFDKAQRDVDEEHLRYCTTCAALAIPQTEAQRSARWGYEGPRCSFCQRGDALITLAQAEARGLIAYAGGFPQTCPVPVPRWVSTSRGTRRGNAPEEDEP
jgi:hypothetical protein